MAFFPCNWGPHYNPRKNFLLYAGYGSGQSMSRYRLRLCLAHVGRVQQELSEFKVNPENGTLSGGDTAMSNCLACGKPLDETGWKLFLTCYPPNNEREDYWAGIHVDCRLPEWLRDQQPQPV